MTGTSKLLAVAIILGLAAAGCTVSGAPGTARTPAPAATATANATSSHSCSLLSRTQVRAALGAPVGPGTALASGDCVCRLADGAGGVDFGITPYSSAAQARQSFGQTESIDEADSAMTVTKISGLGQQAMAATDNLGAEALVLTGSRVFGVDISWPQTTAPMAVTLARDAFLHM